MNEKLLILLAQLGAAALETDRAFGAADHATGEPLTEMADDRWRGTRSSPGSIVSTRATTA